MKNKLLASLLASQLVMTSGFILQQSNVVHAIEVQTYPNFTNNINITVDTSSTVNSIKQIHPELPLYVQALVKNVEIYQANDSILGSSNGNNIKINQTYISNPVNMNTLRDLYYHESSHIIDYNSLFESVTGNNLFDGKQAIGRHNYITGSNFYTSTNSSTDGYKNVNLMSLQPNNRYLISAENPNNVVVVLYDVNKNVTRFILAANNAVQTSSTEYYASVYTVQSTLNLNKFKLYKAGPTVSLSRAQDFVNLHSQLNYPAGSYMSDRIEAFAELSKDYLKYKAGKVQSLNTNVLNYFNKVELNGYKVDKNFAKSINDMPNPVQ